MRRRQRAVACARRAAPAPETGKTRSTRARQIRSSLTTAFAAWIAAGLAIAALAVVAQARATAHLTAAAALGTIAIVPTVYNGSGSYDVRPSQIVLESADGGELIIRWQTWSAAGATGSGTSNPDHGVYPITVRLSDPQYGTFQRMAVTSIENGKTYHGQFELAMAGPRSTLVVWSSPSEFKSDRRVAYFPTGGGLCPRDQEQAISGLHRISLSAACQIASDAANADDILCVPNPGGHVLVPNSRKSTYDGYAVTPTSGLFVFQRGSVYFSLATVCN